MNRAGADDLEDASDWRRAMPKSKPTPMRATTNEEPP
jgi:hypothetical protein